MNATPIPSKRLDDVGRQDGLAGRCVDGARREILEPGAGEGMPGPLAAVLGVAAAVLHAQQLVLPLVELVVADGGSIVRRSTQLPLGSVPLRSGRSADLQPPQPPAAALVEVEETLLHHACDGNRLADDVGQGELARDYGLHVVAEQPARGLDDPALVLDGAGGQVQTAAGHERVPGSPRSSAAAAPRRWGPPLARGEPAGDLRDLVGDPGYVADHHVGAHVADRVQQVAGVLLRDPSDPGGRRWCGRRARPPRRCRSRSRGLGAQPCRHERQDPAPAADVDDRVVRTDLQGVGERAAGVGGD